MALTRSNCPVLARLLLGMNKEGNFVMKVLDVGEKSETCS